MISLARVTPRMGRHYYATDSYYTADRGVENSEWYGVGAEFLSLQGQVDADVFQGLLEGKSPRDGEKFAFGGDNKEGVRRAGIDATFSAPKSVSLACMLGGDERLLDAHKTAVNAALAVIEERYSLTRTGSKENRKSEVTGNIIAAQFHHDLSRAKDPQIHTHCVIVNAVKRRDGEWRSFHNDGLYSNSKILGLVYQNELARQVERLGYSIERKTGGTFEISGYSEEQLRAFSKRRAKIEALGGHDQKAARTLVKVGREAKGKDVPREDLKRVWESEAAAVKLVHPAPKRTKNDASLADNIHYEALVRGSVRHATERDVRFKQEAVEKFALEHNLGRLDWRRLQQEISESQRRGTILEYAEGRFTTQEALATEKSILKAVSEGKGRFDPIVATLPPSIEKNELGLTQGQKSALELTLQSRDGFLAWQGVAGAGKTYAMNALREICAERGVSLRGFAPSAEAAKVLETEAGISSDTVASLLVSKRMPSSTAGVMTADGCIGKDGKEKTMADFAIADSAIVSSAGLSGSIPSKEVWIVDEAGLLSARDAAAFLERAVTENARVILVGDTRQLSAVEAGNPFKLMQEKGIATARLSESRRQKTELLKAAVSLLAAGRTAEGLRLVEGDMVELRRESTRVRHVTAAFMELSDTDRAKTLVLAGTNREREELTKSIRRALREEGKLGETVGLRALRSKDLTREETRSVMSYDVGDVLVFERGKHGFRKNESVRVVGVEREVEGLRVVGSDGQEKLLPVKTLGASSFRETHIEVAVGDKMRWTRNDREKGIRNGQEFRVTAVHEGTILVEDTRKRLIEIDAGSRSHVDHAYVSTVYSSQGKTCENVLIATDRTFGREAMYVALSRAKSSVTIFTEDKDALMKAAIESRAKVSATNLVDEARRENLGLMVSRERAQDSQTKEWYRQKRGTYVITNATLLTLAADVS